MSRFNVALLIPFSFALSACTSTGERLVGDIQKIADRQAAQTDELMERWRGEHVSKLVHDWGPPAEETSDFAGGSVLTYYHDLDVTEVFHRRVFDYVGPRQVLRQRRMFFVNPEGFIYHWLWQSSDIVPVGLSSRVVFNPN